MGRVRQCRHVLCVISIPRKHGPYRGFIMCGSFWLVWWSVGRGDQILLCELSIIECQMSMCCIITPVSSRYRKSCRHRTRAERHESGRRPREWDLRAVSSRLSLIFRSWETNDGYEIRRRQHYEPGCTHTQCTLAHLPTPVALCRNVGLKKSAFRHHQRRAPLTKWAREVRMDRVRIADESVIGLSEVVVIVLSS